MPIDNWVSYFSPVPNAGDGHQKRAQKHQTAASVDDSVRDLLPQDHAPAAARHNDGPQNRQWHRYLVQPPFQVELAHDEQKDHDVDQSQHNVQVRDDGQFTQVVLLAHDILGQHGLKAVAKNRIKAKMHERTNRVS